MGKGLFSWFSGKKNTHRIAEQKFWLQLKMTDPKDPSNDLNKLINFPAGVQVRLMNNGIPLKNKAARNKTDAEGKVCLAPNKSTIKAGPSYHFRIDLDVRTYYDIDTKKLVASKDIKEDDTRNLMEIPMVVDTGTNGFHYDETKLQLTNGMLENYDSEKTGEGTEAEPIILEVRFYWYFLRFKYFDRIRNQLRDVPRGLPVVPKVDNEDYFSRYIKKPDEFGYAIDTEESKIQHYLNLLGFNCAKVDGRIGSKTRRGIKEFQTAYNLDVDGKAGPITKRTIEQFFYRRRVGAWQGGIYWIPVWKKKGVINAVYFEMARPGLVLTDLKELSRFDPFLYTKDENTDPKLVTREEIAEQNNKISYDKLDFLKSRHYYDLPVEWSSKNYWTRYDNDMKKGGRYQKVMKDKVQLYPFDVDESKRADKTKPLMFSLDDIVFVKDDANRSQDIKDKKVTFEFDISGDKKLVSTAISHTPSETALNEKSRYTLFYIDDSDDPAGYKKITSYSDKNGKIKIYNQDADQPFFTKDGFLKEKANGDDKYSNLIHNVSGHTRILYFCNGFYDVYNKRSSRKKSDGSDYTFDEAKHVLGARLAVKNDPDVHVSKSVSHSVDKDKDNAYALENCGNYELHYFHNCSVIEKDDEKFPLAYLLIYWSCRLTYQDTNAPPNSLGGTSGNVDDHRKEGMINAMQRLNKDYYMKTNNDNEDNQNNPNKVNIYIRPFHFMEAKQPGEQKLNEDSNGDLEKALVMVTDDNGGAWMLPDRAKFRAKDYKQDTRYNVDCTDVDGILYKHPGGLTGLTNHHEMGHATGNWDDYLYDCELDYYVSLESKWKKETCSDVPAFVQPYTAKGGPYSCDKLGRMYYNQTPRIRNFWKYVCWLHDEGKPAVPASPPKPEKPAGLLYGFHKGTKFKIMFKGKKNANNFTHNFELKNKHKNVAKAAKSDDDHTITADVKADLLLYKLGDDELSHFTNLGKLNDGYETSQVFKGILVVRTKLALEFKDWIQSPSTANTWRKESARRWVTELNNDMKAMLNGKFYLECNNDSHEFSKIYAFFVPHFKVYYGPDGPPGESHINIKVNKKVRRTGGSMFTQGGKTITVDKDTNMNKIIRYCFGKTTGEDDLGEGDFDKIVEWIKSSDVCKDDTFAMKKF